MSYKLIDALRQYMHNDGSEFVFAYEAVETDVVFSNMESQLAALKEENEELRAEVSKLKKRDVDAIANRICEHLPSGYEIRLCMEKDAGYVELFCPDSERDRNDFECGIYSQLLCAIEVAEDLSKEPSNEG